MLPYFVVFELLGPVVELLGVLAVALGLALGAVDRDFALLFAAAAIGYGTLLSIASLAVEEFSYRRYRRWRDLGAALAASLAENVGYRQLHAWWRLQGLWQALRRSPGEWGAMERRGFGVPGTARPEPAAAAPAMRRD